MCVQRSDNIFLRVDFFFFVLTELVVFFSLVDKRALQCPIRRMCPHCPQ